MSCAVPFARLTLVAVALAVCWVVAFGPESQRFQNPRSMDFYQGAVSICLVRPFRQVLGVSPAHSTNRSVTNRPGRRRGRCHPRDLADVVSFPADAALYVVPSVG